MSKITFYFTDVFSTFDEFKSAINDYTNVVVDDDFLNNLYTKFCIKYQISNIRFTIKEMFLYQFCSIFDNEFSKFKRRFDINEKMKKITLENIQILNEVISNYGENPNYENANAKEALTYITNQSATFTKLSELDAYLKQLDTLLTEGFEEFLNKFKELFTAFAFDNPIYYCDEGDNVNETN